MHAALLDDRAVLTLTGPEASSFLQGLVTNDMAQCEQGHALYAGLLTPQGKILFEFFIAAAAKDHFFIDCARERAADLLKRLSLYKLRAKVALAAAPDLAVAALWDGAPPTAPEGVTVFPDPRLSGLGTRLIGPSAALAKIVNANERGDYRTHGLAHGIPDSADFIPDTIFALDAGFEELHGVNFRKGCYIGQEVTSRMKHRASARRRFVIAEGDGAMPPPGTPVEAGGREVGSLASGLGGRALALVRLDRWEEAQQVGGAITAAGHAVRLRKPEWFHD